MRNLIKTVLLLVILLIAAQGSANAAKSKWVSLDADSKNRLMRIVRSEVENREGFSTPEEALLNSRIVESEKQKELSAYKASINAANSEFARTKKRRDDLMTQFQTAAYDFEELKKSHDNIKTSIDNIDNQIARYQNDIEAQRKSLKTWLKTEKQGEAIMAVIYTRGFKDSAHQLESEADQASAPLMARYMGTYVQSFTKVIDNVLTSDFIRTIEEGTAEWNREEPFRAVLKKETSGTTYLRIKRYELFPFEAPKTGNTPSGAGKSGKNVSVITSKEDLDVFLINSGYRPDKINLDRAAAMIRDTNIANRQAEEGLREQLISYRERINYLEKKIASAQTDKDFQVPRLNQKRVQMEKAHTELEVLRLKKDSAVMSFQSAQSKLHEKKRVHEAIIVKSSLVTAKRSQSPAEASAEAVIEELEDVLNDAKMQHSSSTTEVENNQVVGESSTQAVTEAKIIAVRLISFINEGDSVRVKMAFRVRTVLDDKHEVASAANTSVPAPQPVAVPPASTTPIQKNPSVVSPKPSAVPETSTTANAIAEYRDVQFQLNKVNISGNEVTFFVVATNKAEYNQHIILYDETVGYTLSEMVDRSGEIQTVAQVYMWQGEIKTKAMDAYRGIKVQPGQSIVVELIFRNISPNIQTVPELKLYPYIATRSFIGTYSWYSEYLPFQNVRIR